MEGLTEKEKNEILFKPMVPRYAGYCDCMLGTKIIFRIENRGEKNVRVKVKSESNELFLPFEQEAEARFSSAVELCAEGIFSPRYLAENDVTVRVPFRAELFCEDEKISCFETEVTALPFDYFEGLGGIPEKAACFVRPRAFQTARILKEAKRRLAKWGVPEFDGYANADRNAVKKAVAALFTAVKEMGFTKEADFDLTRPLRASLPAVASARRADPFRLALFAAACLERAGLHPVLALAENKVGVGAWLYDSCFLESSSDDHKTVERYLAEGVEHLAFYEAEDLFSESGAAFPDSAERFLRSLKEERYSQFVDIRRCRMAGFAPCPTRGAGESGYEIYEADSVPPPVAEFKPLPKVQDREKIWERGLLDFSSRNPLLDFKGKNALKVLAPDADFLEKRLQGEGVKLTGGGKESPLAYERELLLLEEKKGILRTPLSERETDQTAAKLSRRNREFSEETGAAVLFLACGFLTYGEDEKRRAPIALIPVKLGRAKGREGFMLSAAGDRFVNLTLVEFLKREYHIDLRGIEESALTIKEMLALFRKETASLCGWEVTEEKYLSVFFFQRFLMWNDLKEHFSEFKKNRAVAALFSGKTQNAPPVSAYGSEEEPLLLPLPSDGTQRAALRLSEQGKNFVLQGPPGTGKSQTIANMIALALGRGKSVLFVAEKAAAIEVVKRRLDGIGIGDFCLELGSSADDGAAFRQFDRVMRLKGENAGGGDAFEEAEYIAAVKELQEEHDALFKKRKLSLSVHDAIADYIGRAHDPDILKIGAEFYESLDEKKLSECRELILAAASAAKECGGVFNSPFENVNLKEYSPAVRDGAVFAARALLGETAHLKCFLSLVLDFFKQKISAFTKEKANALGQILKRLSAGEYAAYFKGATKEEFASFRSANVRLDAFFAFYEKHFKLLVNPESEYEELCEWLSSGGGRLCGAALSLKKRLDRAALHPLSEKDLPKYIEAVVGIFEARGQLAKSPYSKYITERGRISEKKRTAFLAPLKELTEICSSVFSEWSPERFFEGCIRAESGCAAPLFAGFLAAKEGFFRAEERYLATTAADGERMKGEDILGYFSAKASALLDNADLLGARCAYKKAEEALCGNGMKFIGDALEHGSLSPDGALGGFEKSVLEYFLVSAVSSDGRLSRMTSGSAESDKEKFALLSAKAAELVKRNLKKTLINRIPAQDNFREGLSLLYRLGKGARRGRLRSLLLSAPALVKRLCPCLMLSPDAAAQYLVPRADEYDLVIFDEASQMTTAEAVPALARARQAVIVGDNRQLPPTSFFRTAFTGEEDEEEPMESVLDEALAAGFEERSLLWHYRSRHESLVAFSNARYYENRLNTFPSPSAAESKVKFRMVGGVYDRGKTKRNKKEAEALVQEIVRRLQNKDFSGKSIGVVTFSGVQKEEIEKTLSRELAKHALEEAAYGGREPLFVKNLENVQGDERDLILFSVCYGRDAEGKLSYNFGALNRAGGWRRLNVACSRAREEMIVFSSIASGDIDLNRTSSRGVADLKAFLEFAQNGLSTLASPARSANKEGIGAFLKKELSSYGYECREGVGAGNFRLEAAVLDPRDKSRYILGILSDGEESLSAEDGAALLPDVLKRGGWNLLSVSSVACFNNPKREIKRIKDCLDKLTGTPAECGARQYAKPYRHVKGTGGKTAAFITDGADDNEIETRLKEIVAREEPISRAFLIKRCLESFGIVKAGQSAEKRLDEIVSRLNFSVEKVDGREYFYKNPKSLLPVKFRREGRNKRRRTDEDFTPFETAALIKGILEEKVTLYDDELAALVAAEYGVTETDAFSSFVSRALVYGEGKGMFRRALSGRISLA